MFTSNVWSKLRTDTKYQLKEIQNWATHLKHLQSVLLEFDTNNTPTEGQRSRYFYDGLKSLIKLWIANIKDKIP